MKKLTLLALTAAFGLASAGSFAATTPATPAMKAEASTPAAKPMVKKPAKKVHKTQAKKAMKKPVEKKAMPEAPKQ